MIFVVNSTLEITGWSRNGTESLVETSHQLWLLGWHFQCEISWQVHSSRIFLSWSMNPLLIFDKLSNLRGENLCKAGDGGVGYMCPSPGTPDKQGRSQWYWPCCVKQQVPDSNELSSEQITWHVSEGQFGEGGQEFRNGNPSLRIVTPNQVPIPAF